MHLRQALAQYEVLNRRRRRHCRGAQRPGADPDFTPGRLRAFKKKRAECFLAFLIETRVAQDGFVSGARCRHLEQEPFFELAIRGRPQPRAPSRRIVEQRVLAMILGKVALHQPANKDDGQLPLTRFEYIQNVYHVPAAVGNAQRFERKGDCGLPPKLRHSDATRAGERHGCGIKRRVKGFERRRLRAPDLNLLARDAIFYYRLRQERSQSLQARGPLGRLQTLSPPGIQRGKRFGNTGRQRQPRPRQFFSHREVERVACRRGANAGNGHS